MTGILISLLLAPTGKTVVLTYHDVLPKKQVWFDCTPKELTGQLDWLRRKGANFVSIDALAESILTKRPLPQGSVLITFADNYAGFYRYAMPELIKRKIPAALFVHTGYVGSPVGRPKMTWAQLARCKQLGFSVQSQTVSHPADLRKLSATVLIRECEQSAEDIRRNLGERPRFLAYPNGKFDKRVARQAQLAGYDLAFTEACLPAERAPSQWEVPRYVHTKYREAWAAVRPTR
jgi:peptidoglycan/xylan/chitin deacetylase (PgdA/CDA1 family)